MMLLDQPLGRLLLVAALLGLASLGLAMARRRDGVFRPVARDTAPRPADVLTGADLGSALGVRATLVQLSSPGCATCPQVRRVLSALAAGRPGVVHTELDVTQRLDLATRLNVLRTPTVLLLGPRGEVRSRTSGRLDPQRAADALDALDAADATVLLASPETARA